MQTDGQNKLPAGSLPSAAATVFGAGATASAAQALVLFEDLLLQEVASSMLTTTSSGTLSLAGNLDGAATATAFAPGFPSGNSADLQNSLPTALWLLSAGMAAHPASAVAGQAQTASSTAVPALTSSGSNSLAPYIEAAATKYGVPAALLQAVMEQESAMNPDAVSSAGAMGLMQLMPATAQSLGVTNPFDPAQNIDAGAKYLASLLQEVHGNITLALAAYNAGPGAVAAYGGVPPYPQTEQYVRQVQQRAAQLGLTRP